MAFLKAKGQHLFLNNQSFFLRGVGLGGWLLPEGYMWRLNGKEDRPRRIEALIETLCGEEYANSFWNRYYASYIQEKDFAWLAHFGFNSIRLPFNARHLLAGEKLNPDYLFYIDEALRWSKKYGLLLFLDCHGAPGGQTGTNIDDSENDFPALFGNQKHEDELLLLWRLLAERYKNESSIGGYDLLNEPITHWHQELYPQLIPLYRKLIKEIRSIDPNHLIALEGTHWATDFSVFSEMSPAEAQDNLLFEFHKYWNAPDRNSLAPYLAFRKLYEVPIWDGESGENNLYWYSLLFPLLERENISWSFWTYKKMANANSLSSFAIPQDWKQVIDYCKNDKRPANPALIFDSLLFSVSHARFHPTTARAILRLAPTRIPAEAFDTAIIANPKPGGADFRKEETVSIDFADGHTGAIDYSKYAGERQKKSDTLLITLRKNDEITYHFRSPGQAFVLRIEGAGSFSLLVDGYETKNNSQISFAKRGGTHTLTIHCIDGESHILSITIARR